MEDKNTQGNPGKATPGQRPIAEKKVRKPEPKPSSGKSNVGTVIMILVIIALLGGVGFLLFRDTQKTKIIQAKEEKISADSLEILKQKAELKKADAELKAMIKKADSLGMEVESLQALVEDINKLKKDLRSARGSAYVWKQRFKKIKADLDTKQNEINAIIAEKDAALKQVDSLQTESKIMQDTISRINQEKAALKEKVDIASIMRGEELVVTAFNSKGKEYIGPLFKRKHIDKLKISFFLAENKVAPQNEKLVVMRLIEPDGTVLFSGSEGGSFNTAEGEEKMFTMEQKVNFSGSRQKVSFVYKKGSEFKPGKTSVEVYADGYKITSTSFIVK